MSKAADIDDGARNRLRFGRDQECDLVWDVLAVCGTSGRRAGRALAEPCDISADTTDTHTGHDPAATRDDRIHANTLVQKVVRHRGAEREKSALARAIGCHVGLAPPCA